MRVLSNARGQAVVEMAVFGGLILLVLSGLVGYLQQSNDQQYLNMETFRRALEKACNYREGPDMGAGASVQYTSLERRHNADVSNNYKKGTQGMSSGSASVFWAVPKLDKSIKPQTIIVFKLNEDERSWNYRDSFVPTANDKTDDEGNERQKYWTLKIINIDTASDTQYTEQTVKNEDSTAITNSKTSTLSDQFRPSIQYNIVELDKDDKNYRGYPYGSDIKTLWAPVQNMYRDADGQYKYSESAPAGGITRGKVWKTTF